MSKDPSSWVSCRCCQEIETTHNFGLVSISTRISCLMSCNIPSFEAGNFTIKRTTPHNHDPPFLYLLTLHPFKDHALGTKFPIQLFVISVAQPDQSCFWKQPQSTTTNFTAKDRKEYQPTFGWRAFHYYGPQGNRRQQRKAET